MKRTIFFLAFILTLILGACSENTAEESESFETGEEKLTIVTSFYPMYDFTRKIVGEEAEVSMLVHAGSDTHNYEPSAQDMAKIHEADLFIYANPEMEIWVENVLNSLEDSEVVPVMADKRSELIDNEEHTVITEEDSTDHSHGHDLEDNQEDHSHIIDPHTWLDPLLAQEQVKVITEAVIEKDTQNERFYAENSQAFINELEGLHQAYLEELTQVENDRFLVQHAAFGYIANRYDLIQYSLAGLSTQTEANPKAMIEAITFIEEEDMPVIYYNSQTNTQLVETIADEAGIEAVMLHALESLTDEEIEAGLDYISVMENNLEALTKSIR